MKQLIVLILVFCSSFGVAQNFAPKERYLVDSLELDGMYATYLNYLESVLDVYHQAETDVRRVVVLDSLVNGFFDEQWVQYNDLLYTFCSEVMGDEGLSDADRKLVTSKFANSINNYGYIYNSTGKTELGLKYYKEALEVFEQLNDTNGILIQYNNLSIIYQKMGKFDLSMDIQKLHLKLATEYQDPNELFLAYNNIGYDLLQQDYYDQALENFDKALEYAIVGGNSYNEAVVLNNIGSCYLDMLEKEKALDYFYQSVALREEDGRYVENISPLINISVIYRQELDTLKKQGLPLPEELIDTTRKIIDKGIEIAKLGERISDLSSLHMGYALLYLITDDVNKAVLHSDSSYMYAEMNGYKEDLQQASRARYLCYEAIGNTKVAFEMLKQHTKFSEDLKNEQMAKQVIHQNYKLQYELKSASDSIKQQEELKVKNAEIAAEQAEKDSLKKQKYYLYGGLGLVALFGIFMFNRFQVTNRQKNIIDDQKKVVEKAHEQLEAHHNEIQDSIKYAKRIQEAIMPSVETMDRELKDGFVLYLPKDVVAGDFFWMEPVGDWVYFAAADCTGHGVPGAMVSVVCSNALTKALLEEKIQETGKLLDRTREIVIDSLARSGEEVKDGMDISLCALNMQTKELRWTGANNPLWIIRKDIAEVEEYKPNKQPIGKYADPQPFTEHTIQLTGGDTIYVFTDGYQDQFGGEKGKKFKPSQLKKLLISLQDQDMNTQKITLHDTLRAWQGNLEQLDDICVIGVRI